MLFKNPKLVKPLESERREREDAVMESTEGVADQVLKEAEERRKVGVNGSPDGRRSRSASVDSVSTISTNRERSMSPKGRQEFGDGKKNGRSPSASPSRSRGRKRRYNSVSSSSRSLSRSPPPRPESHHKNRRHRTISPDDRGRPHSFRRGSRRSRSGSESVSMDKSRITKQRRLMEEWEDENERPGRARGHEGHPYSGRGERDADTAESARLDRRRDDEDLQGGARGSRGGGRERDGYRNRDGDVREQRERPKQRKERSLSPYSRRLALTQAMNISR